RGSATSHSAPPVRGYAALEGVNYGTPFAPEFLGEDFRRPMEPLYLDRAEEDHGAEKTLARCGRCQAASLGTRQKEGRPIRPRRQTTSEIAERANMKRQKEHMHQQDNK